MNKLYMSIIAAALFIAGCSEQTSSGPDPNAARATVDSANAALEDVLYYMINSGVDDHRDINFSRPYNFFNRAYQQDPNNLDANFGLALTSLLMITQDDDFNNMVFDWESYFGTSVEGLGKSTSSFKPLFPVSFEGVEMPHRRLAYGLVNLPKKALQDPPTFNDIQSVIETALLPRLDVAIKALDRIDNNPDYTYMVSPRMQGDPGADSVEIDLTEIYVLEFYINMLNAMANFTISYNVDIWGYDSLQAISAFSKGGTFLSLRRGGQPMNNAKSSLLTALDKMEAGIDFLQNESDPQDNDLIKLDGSQREIDEIEQQIDEARNMFAGPQAITDDWDDNPATPDETISLDYGQLFDNPIADLKAKLPNYSINVFGVDVTSGYESFEEDMAVRAELSVSEDNYYYYNRSYSWYGGGQAYDYFDSNVDIPGFDTAFDSLVTALMAKPNIKYIYIDVSWGESLTAGNYIITEEFYVYHAKERTLFRAYVPALTWQANSFSTWIFPDPTFNGFMPGMTDSEFKRVFGITADDWEKSPQ